jgi:hypothetical protein
LSPSVSFGALGQDAGVLPDPALTTGAVRTTDMAGVCTDRHTRQYRHWSRERADRILQEYKVHQRAGVPLDPYLNTRRLGEVTENLCGLSLGELCAVEINANLDAAISGTRERLHDWPVRQDVDPISISCSARSIKATSTCSRFSIGA